MRRALRQRRFVALLAAMLATACASPSVEEPVDTPPIDLSPRCEPDLEGFAIASKSIRPSTFENGDVDISTLSSGAQWVAHTTPTLPVEILAWGFQAASPLPAFELALAAALLQSGETHAEPAAFRERVLALGARLSARVEGDWLWLEMRYPVTARLAAADVFEAWVSVERPAPEAFARVRRSVSLTHLAAQSAPAALAERLFEQLQPSGAALRPDRGEVPSTAATTLRLLEAVLRPERSALIHVTASGADEVASLRDRVSRWLGDLPAETEVVTSAPPPAATSLAAPAYTVHVIDRPDSPQVEFLVGFPTVGPRDAAYPALHMLASLLGDSVGGRLFRDLRERHGLAYIIRAHQTPGGRFAVSTRSRPERAIALLEGIESHLDALASLPASSCEVDMLLDRMAGELVLTADDPGARLASWQRDLAWRGTPQRLVDRWSAFEDSASDLDLVAARFLRGPPTVVLVGDAAELMGELARASPDREVRTFDAMLSPR